MIVKKLIVKNMRCIADLNLETDSKINILLGQNAQGKSTVLEALFLTGTSKSHRTSKDKEMIRTGENVSYVMTEIEREKRNPVKVEVTISKTKNVKIDNIKKSKMSDMLGEVNVVIFSSSDIEMIKGEPEQRRHFMNIEISQIYPNYALNLGEYKKTLVQRNAVLKLANENPEKNHIDILEEYDKRLSFYGANIIEKRFEYTQKLFTYAKEFFSEITQNEEIEFKYSPHPKIINKDDFHSEKLREIIFKKLFERREIDMRTQNTSTGPHRDEIEMFVDNLSVRNYGSAGQQRSCAISLKMAEIQIIKEISGEYPVVLLDDIMSELDKDRRKTVIKSACENSQTFITTTHLEEDEKQMFENAKIFYLENGALK